MDLLKTLVLYMTMVFASSVQTMPDAEGFMVQYNTPVPTVQVTVQPVVTPSPTPVPTIAISPNPEHKTLQVGDKGDEVLRLQQALAEYGYYEGELDGRYGNQTRYAVERFQYSHGLVADGIAGKHTLTVLYDSNQVRFAEATPTPSPEADALTIALPLETAVPDRQDTPAPRETSAPSETPVPTDTPVPEATAVPEETVADETVEPDATEEPAVAEPTPVPVFEALEGWVIRLAEQDEPLVVRVEGKKETTTKPILPYQYGNMLYVPLVQVLEGEGIFVVCSDDSVEKIEIGFATSEHLYCMSFTENQAGDPDGLLITCDNEPVELENQDIRLADGLYYVPVDNLTELTGLTFTADAEAKMLTFALPAAE